MDRFRSMLNGFLKDSRFHKEPYLVDLKYLGLKEFIVHPDVLSPEYDADSKFYPEALANIVKQGSLLEVGTGTGIVSVYCQLTNKNKVVATDINPSAVENCRDNAVRFNASIDVRHGSIFEPIQAGEKFDFIFWNHPWYPKAQAEDMLESAIYDYEYRHLDLYLKGAKAFLNDQGKLLLGTSELGNIEWITDRATAYGYNNRVLEKIKYPGKDENGKFLLFELFIFEFTQ